MFDPDDFLMVSMSPVRQPSTDDPPKETAIRPNTKLHLLDRQVPLDGFLVLDHRPNIFDAPVRPILSYVDKFDI